MTFGSVCSGIEAASVAWNQLGWKAAWFSEIDSFPNRVLAHHHPEVPNLGDMRHIHETTEFKNRSIDLLVGGTPCQSFSVAGLRKGLDDPRGNLTLTYLSIVARARPKWLVWENVPGILSDKKNAFGALLGGLGQLGYGFAYRVLDAQYFGVPQRRRRVFVVGYLGDWRSAAAVLFESHSLSWNPPPSRKAGAVVAALTRIGVGASGPDDNQGLAGHLIPLIGEDEFVAHTLRGEGFDASEDGTGRGTPLIPVAFDTTQITSKENRSNPVPGAPCHPLAALAHPPAIAFHNRQDPDVSGQITHPLGAKDNGLGILNRSAVRRLTPRECERLQGFPDDYTLVPYPSKLAADSPRYKAIGNSMAIPVMRWIGERIELVESIQKQGAA